MSFFIKSPINIEKHNEEVARVWDAFHSRKPYRVPMVVYGSIANLFCNPELNTTGYSFKDFFENPKAQIEAQLAYQEWTRFNLISDREMGIPKDGWQLTIDFQNSLEAAWVGCPLIYPEDAIPDTLPILQEKKELLYDLQTPDPIHGNLMGRVVEFYEYMHEHCPEMEHRGRPVLPPKSIIGDSTDGPFNMACNMRGATECCIDIYEDPEYFHALMDFTTSSIVTRIRAIRRWQAERGLSTCNSDMKSQELNFADDTCAMLSVSQYREFVLPYHRRMLDDLTLGGPNFIHLCGNAQHLFPTLQSELNVQSFDTGYPIDFARFRRELGPEATIYGGPTVMLLRYGSPCEVASEVQRICASGIMEGGRMILREANNLAPQTPVENIVSMYEAGKVYGKYNYC